MKTLGVMVIIGLMVFSLIAVLGDADVEPNDSILDPESINEGTYTGSVTDSLFEEDQDCYIISVPADTSLQVKLKKTDTESDYIYCQGYDHSKKEDYGVYMSVSTPGERDTGTYNNYEDEPQNYYLLFSGNGDYELITVLEENIGGGTCCGGFIVVGIVLLLISLLISLIAKRIL